MWRIKLTEMEKPNDYRWHHSVGWGPVLNKDDSEVNISLSTSWLQAQHDQLAQVSVASSFPPQWTVHLNCEPK